VKPETKRQALIVEALEKAGELVLRLQCGLARGWKGGRMTLCPPGTPDLLVVGKAFLETKTDDGELNANQLRMHAILRARGVRVAVVRTPAEALEVVRS
jgi:hypothetical protein